MDKIPVIIGVTGHRNIDPASMPEIKRLVTAALSDIRKNYPHSQLVMLNSLASGGDLLCADAAMELQIPIIAVLPLEVKDYEKDFEGADLQHFRDVLDYSSRQIIPEATSFLRDVHYRDAGLFVARHSHMLIALWDGKQGTERGCGTADIVHYVQHNMASYSIEHILTPRLGYLFKPELRRLESEPGVFERIMTQTDEFNSEETGTDIYSDADRLSVEYQTKYNKSLTALAVLAVVMVLAFLLYDEIGWVFCLVVYAALLAAGFVILKLGRKKRYHEKYMAYRMLAESMRVQNVFEIAGIDDNAASYYTWTQAADTAWIRMCITASKLLNDGKSDQAVSQPLEKIWLKEQLDYHTAAKDKVELKEESNTRTSGILAAVTVIFIIVCCILEYAKPDILNAGVGSLPLRIVILVVIGMLSAAALFLSLYFGKLNLERKITDHDNMIKLYSRAINLASERGLSQELIRAIAREEIIENGNWYSYTRENKLDINI